MQASSGTEEVKPAAAERQLLHWSSSSAAWPVRKRSATTASEPAGAQTGWRPGSAVERALDERLGAHLESSARLAGSLGRVGAAAAHKRVPASWADSSATPAVGSRAERGPVGRKVLVRLSSARREPAQSDNDQGFPRHEGKRVPVRPPAAGPEPGILADWERRSSGRPVGQQLPLPAAAGRELATGRSAQRSDWEECSWRR